MRMNTCAAIRLVISKYISNHRWTQSIGNRKKKEIVSFYSLCNFFLTILTFYSFALTTWWRHSVPRLGRYGGTLPPFSQIVVPKQTAVTYPFSFFQLFFTKNSNSYAHTWLLIHSQRFRDEVKQTANQNAAQSVSEVGSESEVNKLIIPRSRPTLHRTVSLSEWLPPLYQLEDESWDALYWTFIQKNIFQKTCTKK